MFFRIVFIILITLSVKIFADDTQSAQKFNQIRPKSPQKKLELSHKQLEMIKASLKKTYSAPKKEILTVEL